MFSFSDEEGSRNEVKKNSRREAIRRANQKFQKVTGPFRAEASRSHARKIRHYFSPRLSMNPTCLPHIQM